ncbi:unnamed protein product, partial [Iphiclides podalirius]
MCRLPPKTVSANALFYSLPARANTVFVTGRRENGHQRWSPSRHTRTSSAGAQLGSGDLPAKANRVLFLNRAAAGRDRPGGVRNSDLGWLAARGTHAQWPLCAVLD